MAQYHHGKTALAASFLCGLVAFGTTAAHADTLSNNPSAPNEHAASDTHLGPGYHSVMNGISDYDGFDRFRDANGQPLPGWQQELSSPG